LLIGGHSNSWITNALNSCAKLEYDMRINVYPCSCHSIVEQLQILQSARKLHNQNSLEKHDDLIIINVVSCEGAAIPKEQPANV
jgi:hypothetical protein